MGNGSAPPVLGPGDPPPVEVVNAGAKSPFLIVVDHAGRAIPRSLGRLGLPRSALARHIAYDIGALNLARRLGALLGACVISQPYSRLVIDCNRAPGQTQAIVDESDGVAVPGNFDLGEAEELARAKAIHRPYHARIAAELRERTILGLRTVLLCQHSFTPRMNGFSRPWHVGVLHLGDSAISYAMLELLRGQPDLAVGDNQPYAMDGLDFTAPFHADGHTCEMLELEVRQDLIINRTGQHATAARLAPLLWRALEASAADLVRAP